MASGSVSMAEFSTPDNMANGRSHIPAMAELNQDVPADAPSPTSDELHPANEASPPLESFVSAAADPMEGQPGKNESDMDAEGSSDEYFNDPPSPGGRTFPTSHTHSPTFDAASPSSTHSALDAETMASNLNRKRKVDMNEHDYFNDNPELFNLRRSGRARTTRLIVDESSDEDDGPVKHSNKRHRRTNGSTPAPSKTQTPRIRSSDEDSDSDDEEFYTNVRKQSSKKEKQRQKEVANGLAIPSEYQRFSTRRKVAISTYNETSDAERIDEEDVASWEEVAEDAPIIPTIEIVLNYRIHDGHKLTDKHITKDDFDYQVKWEGIAHYHASWVKPNELDPITKGLRKLDNYFERVIRQFIWLEESNASADDREIVQAMHQQKLDEYETNRIPERIVESREGEEEEEYYVKWTNLHYKGCTWESASFINELEPSVVERFFNRLSRIPHSTRQNAWDRGPVSFKWIKEQPSYIKDVKMREFQMQGLNFIAINWTKRKNVILADEMGLGKTVQTVSFISWLVHDQDQQGLHMCVVPLSTMSAWQETFSNWAPDLNVVVYAGAGRDIIQESEILFDKNPNRPKCNVILTTREMLKQDFKFFCSLKFQFLAVDEAHILKNPKAQIYQQLMTLDVPAKLLITGTPMQNTIDELQALLDFLNPGEIEAPEYTDSLEPEEAARILAKFKEAIRPYMLRRTKAEVETDLPPKTEKILRVGISPLQKELTQHIISRNWQALNADSNGPKQTLLNIVMESRKVANHPFLLKNVEERFLKGGESKEETIRVLVQTSGKMVLMDRLLTKLKAEGHRVLLFCQLVSMLNIVDDYLNLKGYKHQRLDGTVSSVSRRQAIEHFNRPNSDDFCFILSTRAGGLGINLATADVVIIIDSDWNPHPDLQAMARAHRIGQTKPVTVYRFVSTDTIEEDILIRARNKLVLEYLVIQAGGGKDEQKKAAAEHATLVEAPQSAGEIEELLKRRSQNIFKEDDGSNNVENLDVDAILAQAEEHQTQEASAIKSSDGGLDFMKALITSVKFEGNWADIIPKEKLEQIEEEDKRRQEEDRLAELAGKPRKRKAPNVLDGHYAREAKKRAKKLATAQDDSDSELSELDFDSNSEKDLDPDRPLENKEWRAFIKAIEKYGAFNDYDATQKIIKEGRFENRSIDVLNAAYDELVGLCKKAIEDAHQKANEEGKPREQVAKKALPAILFHHHSAKRAMNAETILDRANDMRIVRSAVTDCDDLKTFKIPNAGRKSAKYSCPWGDREDAMLLVGIARHGFGGWAAIRDDPDLQLGDKMFLEENRTGAKQNRLESAEKKQTPGAIHLHRRATYLITVLKDNEEGRQNGEAIPRKKKTPRSRVSAIKTEATENGSPAPSSSRPRSSSLSTPKPVERPSSRGSDGSQKNARKADPELERSSKKRRFSNEGQEDRKHAREDHHDESRKRDDERRREEHRIRDERRQREGHRSREEHRSKSESHDHARHHNRDRERSKSPSRRDHHRERDDPRRHNGSNAYRDERRRQYDRPRDEASNRHRDHDRPSSGYRNEVNGHRSHHDHHRSQNEHRSTSDRPSSSRHDRDRHDSRSHRDGDSHRSRDDRHKHDQRHHDGHRSHESRPEPRKDFRDTKEFDECRQHFEKHKDILTNVDDAVKYLKKHSNDKLMTAEEKQYKLKKAMYGLHHHMNNVSSEADANQNHISDLWKYAHYVSFPHQTSLDAFKTLVKKSHDDYKQNYASEIAELELNRTKY